MLIRAYVRCQGKGSYKHKALISIGSYLLNEQKGAKKKALISMQALIKVGSYKHTTTVLAFPTLWNICLCSFSLPYIYSFWWVVFSSALMGLLTVICYRRLATELIMSRTTWYPMIPQYHRQLYYKLHNRYSRQSSSWRPSCSLIL